MQLDTVVSFRLTAEERAIVAQIAREEKRKDGDVLRIIVREYLDRREYRQRAQSYGEYAREN